MKSDPCTLSSFDRAINRHLLGIPTHSCAQELLTWCSLTSLFSPFPPKTKVSSFLIQSPNQSDHNFRAGILLLLPPNSLPMLWFPSTHSSMTSNPTVGNQPVLRPLLSIHSFLFPTDMVDGFHHNSSPPLSLLSLSPITKKFLLILSPGWQYEQSLASLLLLLCELSGWKSHNQVDVLHHRLLPSAS